MDTDKNNKSSEIVEGEILDDGDEVYSNKKRVGEKRNTSKLTSRMPWVLLGALIAFIGGMLLAPWFEYGIGRIFPGVIPPKEKIQITTTTKYRLLSGVYRGETHGKLRVHTKIQINTKQYRLISGSFRGETRGKFRVHSKIQINTKKYRLTQQNTD